MSWAILVPLGVLVPLTILVLVCTWRERVNARAEEDWWENGPATYTLEELRTLSAEHRALIDAGLLGFGQPTRWTHAMDQIRYQPTRRDVDNLRIILSEIIPPEEEEQP